MSENNFENKPSKRDNTLLWKTGIVLALSIFLLIPVSLTRNLVKERQETKSEAISEVKEKWGGEQVISGPILTIPYRVKSNYEVIDYVHVLPESLIVNGKIIPKSLNRGIFEIAVFDSQSTIKGKFDLRNLTDIEPDQLITDKARLSLGISDLKGIQDDVKVKWNSEEISFESGIQKIHKKTLSKGISAQVNVEELDGLIDYEIGLRLKGSGNISFIPVGKETNVALTSSWNSPSFKGNFVPEKREVNKSGFDASWMVTHLNRNFPQSWTNSVVDLNSSAFGIDLFIPVDNYQKSERSIKYALLFIGLTFLIFFFIEIRNKHSIHPIQYGLVGLALSVFYILLISISEHIVFNFAYLIASLATIGLITFFTKSILKNTNVTLLIGGILSTLYLFIFILIQMETYALLTGSIGLFMILGIIMFFTRKIDWYKVNKAVKI